jgi:hypothetical protein
LAYLALVAIPTRLAEFGTPSPSYMKPRIMKNGVPQPLCHSFLLLGLAFWLSIEEWLKRHNHVCGKPLCLAFARWTRAGMMQHPDMETTNRLKKSLFGENEQITFKANWLTQKRSKMAWNLRMKMKGIIFHAAI